MVGKMTAYERALASLNDEPVDQLCCYPLAGATYRKTIAKPATLREMSQDPHICAQSFLAGAKRYDLEFTVTLTDLAVQAHDYGAHVRMDEENTPFVDGHVGHSPEDYEKFQPLDVDKGRIKFLIDANREIAAGLKDKTYLAVHVEGPLLALSQSIGAEQLFMDMFTDSAPVHKALANTTETCSRILSELSNTTETPAILWNFLWGNYSVLGDDEYHEFEANDKYAKRLIKETRDAKLGFAIHNCADMPHLDTQIKEYGAQMYSMAYYPDNPNSPSATKVIEGGYADKCLIDGNTDPQVFARGNAQSIDAAAKNLCQEVKTALCKRGLNSHWCIGSGCEVPPEVGTPIENVDMYVQAVRKYGKMS